MLGWQAAVTACAFAAAALAPSAGGTVLYLPLGDALPAPALADALAHGARPAGTGPGRALILANADPGLGWRALSHGVLTINIPDRACGTGASGR